MHKKLAAILFSVFIVLIIVLADRGLLGPIHFIYNIPYGDKVGHFVLYGLLNFFVTRAALEKFPSRTSGSVALSTGLTLALLIGAEEYSQNFFPTRTADWLDLAASYLGLLAGGWLALRGSPNTR